jgi:hypothetical protein
MDRPSPGCARSDPSPGRSARGYEFEAAAVEQIRQQLNALVN